MESQAKSLWEVVLEVFEDVVAPRLLPTVQQRIHRRRRQKQQLWLCYLGFLPAPGIAGHNRVGGQ